MGEEMLTVKEAADILGVDESTITRNIKSGRIQVANPPRTTLTKRTKKFLIARSEIEKFLIPSEDRISVIQ